MERSPAVAALLLGVCMHIGYGYPSGPPVGNVKGLCETMDPTSGHGPSTATGEPPYVISVSTSSYKANENITVSIKVTSDSEQFKGFFVEARRQDASQGNTTEAIGVFSDQPTGTQLLNCNKMKHNAWGHKDQKTKKSTSITWTAPAGDEGPLAFVATIVKGPSDMYWMDVKSRPITFAADLLNITRESNEWTEYKQRLHFNANQP